MYFLSTSRSVHISAPYKAILQMLHFTNFFLQFKSNLLVKWALFFVEGCFCHGNIGCNFTCASCITCYPATEVAEMFHLFRLLWSVTLSIEDLCLDILPTSVFPHSFQFHCTFQLRCMHWSAAICTLHSANYFFFYFIKYNLNLTHSAWWENMQLC